MDELEAKVLTDAATHGIAVEVLECAPDLADTAAVVARPRVVIGGGSRSMKLRLDPNDLRRLPSATIVDGLARPRTAS